MPPPQNIIFYPLNKIRNFEASAIIYLSKISYHNATTSPLTSVQWVFYKAQYNPKSTEASPDLIPTLFQDSLVFTHTPNSTVNDLVMALTHGISPQILYKPTIICHVYLNIHPPPKTFTDVPPKQTNSYQHTAPINQYQYHTKPIISIKYEYRKQTYNSNSPKPHFEH